MTCGLPLPHRAVHSPDSSVRLCDIEPFDGHEARSQGRELATHGRVQGARRAQRPSRLTAEQRERVSSHPQPETMARVSPTRPNVGVRCVVFMPQNAVPPRWRRSKSTEPKHGLRRRWRPSSPPWTNRIPWLHYVHPFGDPDIIAGQGTVGLEIMEDSPDVDTIAVCVGGGGLAGIAVAAKAIKPGVRIVGVEPEGAPVVT